MRKKEREREREKRANEERRVRQSRTSRSELIASPVTAVETRRDSSRADSRLRHARASENARQPSGSADPRLSRYRDKMMTLTTMSSFVERHFRRECRSLSPPPLPTRNRTQRLSAAGERTRDCLTPRHSADFRHAAGWRSSRSRRSTTGRSLRGAVSITRRSLPLLDPLALITKQTNFQRAYTSRCSPGLHAGVAPSHSLERYHCTSKGMQRWIPRSRW